MGFENRSAEIFTGQALNMAFQIMKEQGRIPKGDEQMEQFLKDLFRLGKKVFETGRKEGFLLWANK